MSNFEHTHEHFADHPDEQVDPHGFSGGHAHGHVILSAFTLRVVLTTLLVFTVLTVFCAQAEIYIEHVTGVILPHWVNVVIAMSIACVKSVIVAAFFMQLKYDNPINTVIMLFCLFALSLFMGFTALDLGGRDRVYTYKAGEIQAGGLGNLVRQETEDGRTTEVAITGPLYAFPAQHLKEKIRDRLAVTIKDDKQLDAAVEAKFEEIRAEVMAHGHGSHAPPPAPTGSSANQSRPRTGTTPGLFDARAPESPRDEGHGGAPHGQ